MPECSSDCVKTEILQQIPVWGYTQKQNQRRAQRLVKMQDDCKVLLNIPSPQLLHKCCLPSPVAQTEQVTELAAYFLHWRPCNWDCKANSGTLWVVAPVAHYGLFLSTTKSTQNKIKNKIILKHLKRNHLLFRNCILNCILIICLIQYQPILIFQLICTKFSVKLHTMNMCENSDGPQQDYLCMPSCFCLYHWEFFLDYITFLYIYLVLWE